MNKRGRWLVVTMLAWMANPVLAQLQPWGEYPAPPLRPLSDNAAGTADSSGDPYRYLERQADPAVRNWINKQHDFTSRLLTHISGREALRQRLDALNQGGKISQLLEVQGSQFYLKTESGQRSQLIVRNAATGGERILLATDGARSIGFFLPSPDARLVALGMSGDAAGVLTLRVLRTSDGAWLDDVVGPIAPGADGVTWKPDGSALFYRRSPAPAANAAPGGQQGALWQHLLGQAPAKDQAVVGHGVSQRLKVAGSDVLTLQTQSGSPYLIAEARQGADRSVYVARLDQLKAAATPWQILAVAADRVRGVWLAGDQLYLLSAKKSATVGLLKLSLKKPQLAGATEVFRADDADLLDVAVASDAVYLHLAQAGGSRLLRLDADGKSRELSLPPGFFADARISRLQADPAQEGALLVLESANTAPLSYRVLADGSWRNLEILRPVQAGFRHVASRRLLLPAQGGRQTALSLLYPQGMKPDGGRPALLLSGSAAGSAQLASFDPAWIAWLERDALIALVHLPEAPQGERVERFLAAADYLVEQGYTLPARLAAMESEGQEPVVAAAIARRPELFAAVRGIADGKSRSLIPSLREGMRYPAAIFTDQAAMPASAAPLVARLQTASAAGRKPVLLAPGRMKSRAPLDELADTWAFLLWQLGDVAFSWSD